MERPFGQPIAPVCRHLERREPTGPEPATSGVTGRCGATGRNGHACASGSRRTPKGAGSVVTSPRPRPSGIPQGATPESSTATLASPPPSTGEPTTPSSSTSSSASSSSRAGIRPRRRPDTSAAPTVAAMRCLFSKRTTDGPDRELGLAQDPPAPDPQADRNGACLCVFDVVPAATTAPRSASVRASTCSLRASNVVPSSGSLRARGSCGRGTRPATPRGVDRLDPPGRPGGLAFGGQFGAPLPRRAEGQHVERAVRWRPPACS
jgi:hypothetical protein